MRTRYDYKQKYITIRKRQEDFFMKKLFIFLSEAFFVFSFSGAFYFFCLEKYFFRNVLFYKIILKFRIFFKTFSGTDTVLMIENKKYFIKNMFTLRFCVRCVLKE